MLKRFIIIVSSERRRIMRILTVRVIIGYINMVRGRRRRICYIVGIVKKRTRRTFITITDGIEITFRGGWINRYGCCTAHNTRFSNMVRGIITIGMINIPCSSVRGS